MISYKEGEKLRAAPRTEKILANLKRFQPVNFLDYPLKFAKYLSIGIFVVIFLLTDTRYLH